MANNSRIRLKTLLTDFYDLDQNETINNALSNTDFNSEEFSADKYSQDALRGDSLKQLLERENQLASSAQELDSNIQVLIYENYSKFISATDTIRSMKDQVSEIQVQVEILKGKMDSVEKRVSSWYFLVCLLE